MDFTPHTEADVVRMLAAVGLRTPEDLFAHIPGRLHAGPDLGLPGAMSEPEVIGRITAMGARVSSDLICFAGGGVYDHYLPPVVRSPEL